MIMLYSTPISTMTINPSFNPMAKKALKLGRKCQRMTTSANRTPATAPSQKLRDKDMIRERRAAEIIIQIPPPHLPPPLKGEEFPSLEGRGEGRVKKLKMNNPIRAQNCDCMKIREALPTFPVISPKSCAMIQW